MDDLLKVYDGKVPHDVASRRGYWFHGMSGSAFSKLTGNVDSPNSIGLQSGGFAPYPINIYGPKYVAVELESIRTTYFGQGNQQFSGNTYSESEAKEYGLTPYRSKKDAEYYGGQSYAIPRGRLYEADSEGNILRRLKK